MFQCAVCEMSLSFDKTRIHYMCQLLADAFMFGVLRCYFILANHLERVVLMLPHSLCAYACVVCMYVLVPLQTKKNPSKYKAKRQST